MNRTRWLVTIALGLTPMLTSMAMAGHVGNLKLGLSAAASSSSNAGAKSGGKSNSDSSSSNSSSSSSTNSSSSTGSSSSSSSSAVSVGVAPKAKVTNPHGPIATPCANCHSYTSWKPIRSKPEFDHSLTAYPLRGMHQNVGCTQCHTKMVFKNVSSQCSDCHADLHKGQFGANCSQCHTVKGWQVSMQAINNHSNRFPLVGGHAVVQCEQCHKQAAAGQFVGMSTTCYSCHQQDFRTPVIDHVGLGFPRNCESCHSLNSWFNAKFDHLRYTGYALSGAHATLPCAACHANNVFKGTSAQCYSCHQADFNSSNNPPHVKMGLPRDCAICHSTVDWANAKFDHALYAKYPLTGKHAVVACAQCHTNNNYNATPSDCFSCHKADFQGATNPPHASGGFPTDCSLCHTTSGWLTSTFNHNTTGFALTGAHVSVDCAKCHTNGNYSGSLPTDCFGCHQADYQNTATPPHAALASMFPTAACATCHTTSNWDGAKFDHNKTTFPLTGKHVTVPCAQCHTGNDYLTRPTDCFGCHQTDYNATTDPNHKAANYPTTCATCHNTSSWLASNFDHSQTGFPLTGAHVSVNCVQCHVNNNYNLTAANTVCSACHMTDYNGTKAPPHAQLASMFPASACATCHTTASWDGSKFDHSKTTFPLTGKHITVQCVDCHVANDYLTRPTDCYGCHKADYDTTASPNHKAANYPTTCTTCHNTSSWITANFDHSKTGFPLTGAHVSVNCVQCHVNNNYNLTAANAVCSACHMTDYNGTKAPPHAQLASMFPASACATCHTTASWDGSKFDHSKTTFPLTGKHVTLTCIQCHVNNDYLARPTDCFGCHQTDYNGTTDPNHKAANYPTTCLTCHNTSSWTNSTFNHSSTGFPLTGSHVSLSCNLCHVNNNYNLGAADTACSACHMNDYNTTANPNHKAANYPTTCATCHNTTSWATANFNHNSTGFPLTGAHISVNCVLCHVNNNYNLTAANTACSACHMTDYNGTKDPPHAQLASTFPASACATCHTTATWDGAKFDHSKTGFALTGAHTSLPCTQCHASNNYNLSSAACITCHQADFNGATSPQPHTGFPTDCTLCHNTTLWTQSTFNHSTVFPLTGAHATLACVSCHTNNNYTTVPKTCIGCHQADFSGTANPSHAAAGFPTTCDTCHSNTAWTPIATFNHTLYANYALTGAHTTLQCVQCHTNNNFNNLATACYSCHAADYNGTTNPAHKAANYPTTCETCHSTTSWAGATFDHSTTGFPLTGAHTALTCATCHTNNNYNLTAANALCSACHMKDYNGTTDPAHAAAGFPTTCNTCHTTTNWSGATFNHNNTPFPLTGAHVNVACTKCHINNVFAGTPTDCYSCHKADYTGTTNPNHSTAGWPTTCTTCHTTTAWMPATLPASYHTFFPLNHGDAKGVCTTCHTNSSDYSVFTCTGCHGGNNAANFRHPNVNGYQYLSTACLACHKNGGGG